MIIYAATSSGSCSPSALIQSGLPLTGKVSIKEAGTEAADVKVAKEGTDVLKSHPGGKISSLYYMFMDADNANENLNLNAFLV